jgi:hypothetical protein
MKSYYLGRLIDSNLQHAQSKSENNKLSAQLTIQSIRKAEWELQITDFEADLKKPMEEKGWSLDFIYLDQGENRF